MKDFIKFKVEKTVSYLKELTELNRQCVDDLDFTISGYKKDSRPPMPDESWGKMKFSHELEGIDEHYWIYKKIRTPKQTNPDQKLIFEIKTGKEGQWDATNPQCMFFVNGSIVQGFDTNHTEAVLDFDTEYDIHINLYTGMTGAKFNLEISLVTISTTIEELYYDMCVPAETLDLFNPKSDEYVTTLKHLELACNILDLRKPHSDEFYASVCNCISYLREEYYQKVCGKSDAVVSCIGHTHIDVAWQWTLAQTEEKAQRSFATALQLMKRYPEYKFMSSQPQLYEYIKQNDSELYDRIKEKIADGQFEPEGAMWLEADCNLSSGESLIRQVMFGKRFFKDEFDIDSKILWLPDVFGYSAALPQILKKCGVDKFVTSKISWNDTNTLPYDTFMWEGLDGTEIFTSFITDQEYDPKNPQKCYTTYVGDITPAHVLGSHYRFQQKEFSNKSIITFGYGDGGGGTTPKMLEYYRRLKYGLPGIPKTVIEPVSEYLEKLEADFKENSAKLKSYPRWVGELYLEYHRGTYTSVAKNKKNNRECEFLMQTAEQLSVVSNLLCGTEYPQDKINSCWKTVLLNQFHDIIPGSSIKEVYDDSDVQYAKVRKSGNEITENALSAIANGIDSLKGYVIYNPNSFQADGYVKLDGKTVYAGKIPALGWKTVSEPGFDNGINVGNDCIENTYYIIKFDENRNISSIYDKINKRDVIKPGCAANTIEAFEDLPHKYDNWELPAYYKQKRWDVNDVESFEPINDGARAGYRIKRKFLDSVICQSIYVYDHNPRIDFETYVDWKEHHIVLKAAFPLNIHSDKAVYETQFGYLERPTHENTSWDAAKFEVCAHKYADISEDDYGVALLNDCKYGYNAEGNTLKLTMLKCGTFPWENADCGEHYFTYSLVPHSGNHKQGDIIKQSYQLNRPLTATLATGEGSITDSFSFVSCDKENIVVETIKKAEDSDAIVIRAYDAFNRKGKATFSFGFDIKRAYVCDMLENKLIQLEISENRNICLDVSNFEIVTIMVE